MGKLMMLETGTYISHYFLKIAKPSLDGAMVVTLVIHISGTDWCCCDVGGRRFLSPSRLNLPAASVLTPAQPPK